MHGVGGQVFAAVGERLQDGAARAGDALPAGTQQ
jgi:hypothetical protein